jgi:magnesium-protoporphyrin O-methyltransferase
MLDPALGRFDYVVAMDSLIHYRPNDTVGVLGELCERTERSVLFTFAPRTPALTVMHTIGRMFPRADRAPAIEPVRPRIIRRLVDGGVPGWTTQKSLRVATGFYISEALEVVRQ